MNQEYNQPTTAPVAKVAAVGQIGVVLTLAVTLLAQFNIIIPADVSTALVAVLGGLFTIGTFVAGYLKKDVKPVEAVQAIKRAK